MLKKQLVQENKNLLKDLKEARSKIKKLEKKIAEPMTSAKVKSLELLIVEKGKRIAELRLNLLGAEKKYQRASEYITKAVSYLELPWYKRIFTNQKNVVDEGYKI